MYVIATYFVWVPVSEGLFCVSVGYFGWVGVGGALFWVGVGGWDEWGWVGVGALFDNAPELLRISKQTCYQIHFEENKKNSKRI